MIALVRPQAPAEYANLDVAGLVQKFKTQDVAVWDLSWLKEALSEMGRHKCAYCERSLKTPSVYLEVEHFECKDDFPDKVIEWSNLLPCCKRCNGTKSSHNVQVEPIINPCADIPSFHLAFKNYQYIARTQLGISTLDVLEFNFDEKLMMDRFQLGNDTTNRLSEAWQQIPQGAVQATASDVRKVKRRIKAVLQKAQKDQPYAATIATLLASDTRLGEVKAFLQLHNEWSDELNALEAEVRSIAYV